MSIVLPIVIAAVLAGLFGPRTMDRRILWALGAWIALIVAYTFVKS